MRAVRISVFVAAVAIALCGLAIQPDFLFGDEGPKRERTREAPPAKVEKPANVDATSAITVAKAVERGIEWLVSVQGGDGGWGQDGGAASYVRQGENLESSGNDVANTAVAALAIWKASRHAEVGPYRDELERAVEFILRRVEQSPAEGLAITSLRGTQIQRKLGPFIDTFLTSMLFGEIEGEIDNPKVNARVQLALQKCVNKIQNNQAEDGSWNLAGGWAPILGTSLASRSLFAAEAKGFEVEPEVLAKVDTYTKDAAKATPASGGVAKATPASGGVVGGITGGFTAGPVRTADAAAAGVPLYRRAQMLEQLSRTEEDRQKNAEEIAAISKELSNARFVEGYGSIGGEEFFSYLNIGDSLRRTGGEEWEKWNSQTQTKIVRLQNGDGSWAGHHCITGRVAVTSAAILNLLVEKEPLDQPAVRLTRR